MGMVLGTTAHWQKSWQLGSGEAGKVQGRSLGSSLIAKEAYEDFLRQGQWKEALSWPTEQVLPTNSSIGRSHRCHLQRQP